MVKLNRYFLIFIPLFLISVNSSAGLLQTLKYTVSTIGSSSIFRVSSAGTSSASVVGATAGTANGSAAVVRTVGSDFANLLNKPSTLSDFSRVVEPVSLAAMAGAALPFLRIASPLGVAVSFLPDVIKWLKDAGLEPGKDASGNTDYTKPFSSNPIYASCVLSGGGFYQVSSNVSPQSLFVAPASNYVIISPWSGSGGTWSQRVQPNGGAQTNMS